jgi:hypothetical protein
MPQVHGAVQYIPKKKIVENKPTFRELVTTQYMAILEHIRFDLVIHIEPPCVILSRVNKSFACAMAMTNSIPRIFAS